MGRLFVVDTGILFSNWPWKYPEHEMLTSNAVLSEIQNRPSKSRVETLLSVGRLHVDLPSATSMARVRDASRKTGDLSVLSDVDIGLIAVALDHAEKHSQVIVVSTDLAVLNTASSLGLGILDPSGRMRERRRWVLVCPACGHVETVPPESLECPVCGTLMRRRTKSRSSLHRNT